MVAVAADGGDAAGLWPTRSLERSRAASRASPRCAGLHDDRRACPVRALQWQCAGSLHRQASAAARPRRRLPVKARGAPVAGRSPAQRAPVHGGPHQSALGPDQAWCSRLPKPSRCSLGAHFALTVHDIRGGQACPQGSSTSHTSVIARLTSASSVSARAIATSQARRESIPPRISLPACTSARVPTPSSRPCS